MDTNSGALRKLYLGGVESVWPPKNKVGKTVKLTTVLCSTFVLWGLDVRGRQPMHVAYWFLDSVSTSLLFLYEMEKCNVISNLQDSSKDFKIYYVLGCHEYPFFNLSILFLGSVTRFMYYVGLRIRSYLVLVDVKSSRDFCELYQAS